MLSPSFLDFQYNLSNYLRKPSRLFSRDKLNSGQKTVFFQPNIDEMEKVLDKFDSNRDGKISQQEYRDTLNSLGIGIGNVVQNVQNIFRVVDLDGDGFINFEEFMEAQKKDGGIRIEDIQSAFKIFDKNSDGKISAQDVEGMLRRLGDSSSLEDCRQMVRAVDIDGDGMVDMHEFMAMMTQSLRLV